MASTQDFQRYELVVHQLIQIDQNIIHELNGCIAQCCFCR